MFPSFERRTSQHLFLACCLAILARIFLIVALIATPVVIISYEAWELLYVVTLGIFVLVVTAYITLALVLRCPSCGEYFLIESMGPKRPGRRPAAQKTEHFDYWGTIVWSVVRHQEFACMHCGVLYHLG